MVLTSCISFEHHPYPSGWERPVPAAENICTDISGAFDDYGQGEPEKNSWTGTKVGNLSMYFWPVKEWTNLRPAKVVIRQSDNVMKVSSWTATEVIAERELKKDEKDGYSCTVQGIVLDRPGHSDRALQGYVGRTVTLVKDSEGAMILKLEHSSGGLVYILPVYFSDTLWRRYPALHKP
jgi:hypothetical protein